MTTPEGLPPPETVELGDCADLWLLAESEVDEAVERYGVFQLISPDERIRHDRLRSPRARRQHLGARMLVRYVLAAYTNLHPSRLRFQAGPFGRPELVPNPLRLDFNISHTDGLIGCILTRDQRCGLDLEGTPPAQDVARAILQFLATEEQNRVALLPAADQPLAALDYWVVKEAYLKALGVGFSRGLDSFVVRGLPGPTIMIKDPAGTTFRWQLELRQMQSNHRLAVALAHPLGSTGNTPVRILDFAAFLRIAGPGFRQPAPTTSPDQAVLPPNETKE